MKITAIETSNFLGARAVDVKLSKPIALFAGKNGAGKSSIQEAVRMALTGESVRVGLKKEYGALITEGNDSGFVEVFGADEGQEWTASMVLPAGKGQHSTDATLPFVLDAQRFAHMSADDRRAFLFGLMGLRTDGAAVKDRLLASQCDAKKVEQVLPLLRAGFDAGQKEAAGKAREAKGSWKQVTGGETYGSVKAATFKMDKPTLAGNELDQARADMATLENEIEAETNRLGGLQSRARQAAEQSGKLASLRDTAGRFARIQEKLNKDENELKEWETRVADTKAKASGERAVHPHPCPHCGGLIEITEACITAGPGELQRPTVLRAYVEPETVKDPEAAVKLPEYEHALKLMQRSVENDKRDLAAADAAAKALDGIDDAKAGEVPSEEEIAALKVRIDALKKSRSNQQTTISTLEQVARAAKEADEKTARAQQIHLDVQAWEAISDALAPDGIPSEILAEALGPINERLAQSASLAEWCAVEIHADMQITYGPRAYALISESEKWRADAMIAEAVSHLSGVRLLVLDRFDVLDLTGREDLLLWLDDLAAQKEIDSALIFGTLKGIPAQLPETVAGFWIENGTVFNLKAAA